MGDESQNKEVVRKIEEAWSSNKLDALDQYFGATFNNHSGVPGIPPGLAGAKMAHGAAMAAFPDRKSRSWTWPLRVTGSSSALASRGPARVPRRGSAS